MINNEDIVVFMNVIVSHDSLPKECRGRCPTHPRERWKVGDTLTNSQAKPFLLITNPNKSELNSNVIYLIMVVEL